MSMGCGLTVCLNQHVNYDRPGKVFTEAYHFIITEDYNLEYEECWGPGESSERPGRQARRRK